MKWCSIPHKSDALGDENNVSVEKASIGSQWFVCVCLGRHGGGEIDYTGGGRWGGGIIGGRMGGVEVLVRQSRACSYAIGRKTLRWIFETGASEALDDEWSQPRRAACWESKGRKGEKERGICRPIRPCSLVRSMGRNRGQLERISHAFLHSSMTSFDRDDTLKSASKSH